VDDDDDDDHDDDDDGDDEDFFVRVLPLFYLVVVKINLELQ